MWMIPAPKCKLWQDAVEDFFFWEENIYLTIKFAGCIRKYTPGKSSDLKNVDLKKSWFRSDFKFLITRDFLFP